MTDVAERPLRNDLGPELLEPANHATLSQSGAAQFPGLVWAHFRWERERHGKNQRADELEREYLTKLAHFQKEEGELEQVYWSTRKASAVAMTVKREPRARRHWQRGLRLREHDDVVHLHRVSDWVTRDAPAIADLLQECDLLSIRVGEVLRGTSERIAMRWLLAVEAHLLGFFERETHLPDERAERELAASQRKELGAVEQYYHRAASKAGRIVYVTGMLIGVVLAAVFGSLLGLVLWQAHLWSQPKHQLYLLVICYVAGAGGALVSAMSRMSKIEQGRFNIDFELGRPLLRRLGVFRPFVGAIFGVALYCLLESGILDISVSPDHKPYYYGFTAFLAGFSERFALVVMSSAETRLGGSGGTKSTGSAPTEQQV